MHQALNEADKDFQTQYLILEVQIVHIQQSLHHQELIWHNHEEDLQYTPCSYLHHDTRQDRHLY